MQADPAMSDRAALEARRRFLATCGKLAIATPPAITLLLARSEVSYAVALSGNGSVKQQYWLWERRLRGGTGPRRTRNRPRIGEAEAEW